MAVVAQLLKHKPDTIYSVAPGAPVLEAIRLMAEHGVGALLVMEGQQLVGVVSERDYARKVILKGRSSSETSVRQIMSSPVWTVRPDQSVRECMQIVNDKRVRHLPVVENGRLAGIVSIGDVVKNRVDEVEEEASSLRQFITTA